MDKKQLQGLLWKSPACFGGLGCVQVAYEGGNIYLRDTERPDEVIEVSPRTWLRFRDAVKRGEYDPPGERESTSK